VGYDVKWRARVAADGENAAHYAVPNEQSNDAEVYAVWKRARMEKTRLITNGVVKNVRGASDDVYEIRAVERSRRGETFLSSLTTASSLSLRGSRLRILKNLRRFG
jgi:hypothetical protein